MLIYLTADMVVARGFGGDVGPTAFMTFDYVSDNWNSYEYGFFEARTGNCEPEKYTSSPRMRSFETSLEINELAQRIVGDSINEREKTYKVFEYVSENVLYTIYTDLWRNPTEVLETMDGDCTDKSILMVTLLDEIGVESYVVYGGESELDTQHAWVVASIDGTWFEVDATSDDFYSVYKCKKDIECANEKYYNSVLGLFGSEVALECK